MIKDQDISIVVQGPVLRESSWGFTTPITEMVCQRLRNLFPQSEIILSTWEGTDPRQITYDKIIFSKDPGATWFNIGNEALVNNCNRLIVSTHQGIKIASRPHVFKIRSDLFVCSKNFLNYFNAFPYFDSDYKYVKNRIIAFSLFSIKGHKTSLFTMKRPYHISDWAYFGHTQDLADLYDIPLAQEPEFSQWFLKRCKNFFDIEPHRIWKMPPEQYVTTCFLQKHTNIILEHTNDLSHDNEKKSERLLANNFLILDQTQFSLISLKYVSLQLLFDSLLSRTALFYSTWLKDYYKYCGAPKNCFWIVHHIQALWRILWYRLFNGILRFINKKNLLVQRLIAFWIKKIK